MEGFEKGRVVMWIVIAPTLSSAGPRLVQVGLPGAKSKLHSIRWTAVHSGKLLQVRENIWSFAFSCRDFAIFSLLFVISFSARQPRRATQNGLFGDSREQANAGPSLDLRDGCGKGFTRGKKECGERFYRNTYSGNLDNFLRITGSTRYRLNDPK